jgi:transposase-like protein
MRDAIRVGDRRRRSQGEAESLVREFEQSGLSRKAFSSAHGIALHTLDYYRARHRTGRATPAAQELLPVDLISASPVGGCLRVELANGRRIVVEAGFDVAVLKRLIASLEG